MSLTTLAQVKEILHITDSTNDVYIQSLIDSVSASIENYCDREFSIADHFEFVNAVGHKIILKHTPINTIYFSGSGSEEAILVKYTGSTLGTINVKEDRIIVSNNFIPTTLLYADYSTISDMCDAIEALTDFNATLVSNGSCKILYQGSISILCNEDSYLEKVEEPRTISKICEGEYETDSEYPHLVYYSGGYTTIPSELTMVANKIVCNIYNDFNTNSSIQSENIGDYSYTISNKISKLIGSEYSIILSQYKNFAI